jgi:hypothetical protein
MWPLGDGGKALVLEYCPQQCSEPKAGLAELRQSLLIGPLRVGLIERNGPNAAAGLGSRSMAPRHLPWAQLPDILRIAPLCA